MSASTAGGRNSKNPPKHPLGTDAEGILEELTTRQHLAPHRRLRDVVAETIASTGVCPVAADRALEWLNLSGERSVGRLKRGELIQLARSMYRFWTESTNAGPQANQAEVGSFSPDAR